MTRKQTGTLLAAAGSVRARTTPSPRRELCKTVLSFAQRRSPRRLARRRQGLLLLGGIDEGSSVVRLRFHESTLRSDTVQALACSSFGARGISLVDGDRALVLVLARSSTFLAPPPPPPPAAGDAKPDDPERH